MRITGMVLAGWLGLFVACSENSGTGGDFGYSQLSSQQNNNSNQLQNNGNAVPNSPMGPNNLNPQEEGNGGLISDESTSTSTETPVDPKPIGSKTFVGQEIVTFFDDHLDIQLDLGASNTKPNGIADDQSTVRNLCNALRYDNFKVITGGLKFDSPADKYIAKWDETAAKFRVLSAEEAGNSRIYKLECSND